MSDMLPIRLQLSRKAGFDLQAVSQATNGLPAVNCARPSSFGNPFIGEAEACVEAYRKWLNGYCDVMVGADQPIKRMAFIAAWNLPSKIRSRLPELRGKNLACWCDPGKPCHADVLLELANRPICEAA